MKLWRTPHTADPTPLRPRRTVVSGKPTAAQALNEGPSCVLAYILKQKLKVNQNSSWLCRCHHYSLSLLIQSQSEKTCLIISDSTWYFLPISRYDCKNNTIFLNLYFPACQETKEGLGIWQIVLYFGLLSWFHSGLFSLWRPFQETDRDYKTRVQKPTHSQCLTQTNIYKQVFYKTI